MVLRLKQRAFDPTTAWMQEVADTEARGTWQDEGFINVKVTGEATLVRKSAEEERYAVTLRVEEGQQRRLAEIRFEKGEDGQATVFPAEAMRKVFPIKDGDVLNVAKVREGLAALGRLYASEGYIDFTAAPMLSDEDEEQRIVLQLILSEEKQYRVGGVALVGIDASKQSLVKWNIQAGDTYNPAFVEPFLKENRALFPKGASREDMILRRDVEKGLVYLTFDFRDCQPMPPDAQS